MARDFSVVLDELQKAHAPKLSDNLQHDLNTLSQIRLTQGTAQIPGMLAEMDPSGHPGYVGLIRDKVAIFALIGAALEKTAVEMCKELSIEVPPELGRLESVLPYLTGGDLPKATARAVDKAQEKAEKAKAADKTTEKAGA